MIIDTFASYAVQKAISSSTAIVRPTKTRERVFGNPAAVAALTEAMLST